MSFKMKKIIYINIIIIATSFYSCREKIIEADFEDVKRKSIYSYLVENKDEFSDFISIIERGGIDETLRAYNPNGNGYTLFAPNNEAIDQFIQQSEQFSSLNDLLNNQEYVDVFSRYHVVSMKANTNEFPFGSFMEPSLSDDYLTVSFIVENDISYYMINNQARVIKSNIEVSNGYIHHIQTVLKPIIFTTYQWLEESAGFSIFKSAVDLTGLQSVIDINMKELETPEPVTLMVEHDSIYNKIGIKSVSDLIDVISPGNSNYTDESNPLYNFVGYHVLNGRYFIDNFFGVATNYTTFSETPLNINGLGLDLEINKGKEIFDTIVNQSDTTIINYIKFLYDESNVITQSGAIHFIDRMMKQHTPSRANMIFEFREESLLFKYQAREGTFQLDDKELLNYINWFGSDLFYVNLGEQNTTARGGDYLMLNGNFSISYSIPKIVQGKYRIFLGADALNNENAVIELFVDGKVVGGLINLTTGGTFSQPFRKIEIGTVDFNRYARHLVEIYPVIPGRFLWDYIQFEPY
jgi:uncharacterized surface protein with fasciclin (FAS1) repeats